MSQPLTVLGLGAVTPYNPGDAPHGTLDAQRTSDANTRGERLSLDLALLERTLRRGLSDVTRLFMHAAKLALDDAGRADASILRSRAEEPLASILRSRAEEPLASILRSRAEEPLASTHVIFASAFGEIATAEALLAEAYDTNGSSPARFRNSVHNTSPGLLSISSRNRLACTAIAAGWETVPMALFEASAQLASQAETVLLVFAEERVPSALSDQHPHGPLGAAFVLTRATAPAVRARGTLLNLRRQPRNEQIAPAAALDRHPLAPVLALIEALSNLRSRAEEPRASTTEPGSHARTLALSEGENPWCVDVHAGEPS